MKRIVLIMTFAVATMLLSGFAFAAGTPELRGTWRGPSVIQTPSESWEGKAAYVINVQNGLMFAGYKLWFNKSNVLVEEKFAGIYDNGQLFFGEGKDGYGYGYLTGKQNMAINYVEQGSTVKAILYKLERVHFTTGFVEIDKDGNNIILTAEITNHYPLNAKRIMKEADANKDDKLTKKEWEAWKKANDWE